MYLKVKVFRFKPNNWGEEDPEKTINEWLEPLKHIEVLQMTQSFMESRTTFYLVITILYKENFQS